MIGQATAHRRANAFAQALETADTRSQDAQEQAEDDAGAAADRRGRLLTVAGALAEVPRPQLDAEVKTVHRARLIAAMESALADGSLAAGIPELAKPVPGQRGTHRAKAGLRRLRPRSGWSRRLAAGGLTVGVAAGAFSGVAAASTNALPGDTLYGLKRGMEDLRLGMADDDADRGKLLLDMASTRLQEARRLLDRRSGPLDPHQLGEVRGALLGMHHEAAEGHQLLSAVYRHDGSLAPIEALNDFSRQHRVTWTVLRNHLPAQLSGLGARVSSVFDAIERDVAPLQSQLPTGSPGDPPGHRGHGPAAGTGSGTPSAAAGGSGGPEHGGRHGGSSTGPAAPTTSGQGLIGGAGLLDVPGTTGGPSAPSGAGSGGDGKSAPDVTLPPLLPGLLPDLGIGGEDGG